jgi:hypothetical protein
MRLWAGHCAGVHGYRIEFIFKEIEES